MQTRDEARVTPLRPLGDAGTHHWRVRRMARATGVDLAGAFHEGALKQAEWAAMITRCRGCRWTEGCGRWLDRPEDALRDAPDGCENRGALHALRAEQTEKDA
jgi:hypothetical protein